MCRLKRELYDPSGVPRVVPSVVRRISIIEARFLGVWFCECDGVWI